MILQPLPERLDDMRGRGRTGGNQHPDSGDLRHLLRAGVGPRGEHADGQQHDQRNRGQDRLII